MLGCLTRKLLTGNTFVSVGIEVEVKVGVVEMVWVMVWVMVGKAAYMNLCKYAYITYT